MLMLLYVSAVSSWRTREDGWRRHSEGGGKLRRLSNISSPCCNRERERYRFVGGCVCGKRKEGRRGVGEGGERRGKVVNLVLFFLQDLRRQLHDADTQARGNGQAKDREIQVS